VTSDRAFEIPAGKSLTLQSMTIQNGNTPGAGGAIDALGDLYLINVTIQNNTAAQGGGGIHASGTGVIKFVARFATTPQNDGGGVEVERCPVIPAQHRQQRFEKPDRNQRSSVLETGPPSEYRCATIQP
jgi:predicted outer membrane repeat protein